MEINMLLLSEDQMICYAALNRYHLDRLSLGSVLLV